MTHLYTLNDNYDPIAEESTLAWARWMDTHKQMTCVGTVLFGDGTYVSTCFFGTEGCLWETMVFGPNKEITYQERYSTHTDTYKGHERAIARCVDEDPRRENTWCATGMGRTQEERKR